jgi:hypothetical protein
MAETPPPSSAPPALAAALDDLPAKGADLVDTFVELVRDKAVRPLTLVARALVYGIVVLVAALVTAVLVSIASIRLLTVYAFREHVWISDLVVGGLFVLLGLVAWSRRTAKGDA